MAKKKGFDVPAGMHSVSYGLAVTTKKQAIRRNEELKQLGIAAEHPVLEDGQVMPMQFRDRNGRRQAHEAYDRFDRDAGYSDRAPH